MSGDARPTPGTAYGRLFAGLSAALLVLMLAIAPDFGVTWDEPQQHAKAHALVDYLSGREPALSVPIDGAHLYGAPLGVAAVLLEPLVRADPYVIRHVLIALTGWIGLVLCGLLADRLFGPPHGLLAMGFLAACPRYMADAMNNPKDLPFATVGTAVLLCASAIESHRPYLRTGLAVTLGVLLALGLNVRPGALLFIGYVGIVLLVRLQLGRAAAPDYLRAAGRMAVIVALALALGWIAWPWAYAHPFAAPFAAMRELGHFGWAGKVLFGGVEYPGTALPSTYVPMWFWLTTPPVLLGGLVLSLRGVADKTAAGPTIALLGAVAFPVVYAIGTRATLYDGIRHLLFVLPPLAVLAAAGWLRALESPGPWRAAVAIALSIGIAEPIVFQYRNHPNQTAYVQPLAGGPAAAYGRYDLDYWGNCVLEALAQVDRMAPPGTVRVTGSPMIILQADMARFPRLVLAGAEDGTAGYSVELARGGRPELQQLAAAPDVVARVRTADGALLCAVRARQAARR